ncbi:MAG TPA: hypothetical protein VK211_03340, partial [Kamptonema sp.]|nr:hypothetical protein [Kamptonema sp.]
TNLIADVMVARDSLIKSRKADIQAYLKAVDKAVYLLAAGDEEALKIAGKKLGVTAKEIAEQLQGVKLFNLDSNKSVAFNKDDPKSLIGNLDLTVKAAKEFKIISKPMEVKTIYDDSIVNSM